MSYKTNLRAEFVHDDFLERLHDPTSGSGVKTVITVKSKLYERTGVTGLLNAEQR